MGACGAFVPLRVLVSKFIRTSRWWCVYGGNFWWYLPGTACLYSVPSPVDRACLRNHRLHACRHWYCGCHPWDTAVGRDRTHHSFSSIRAVVYGLSRNIRSKSIGLRRIIVVFICIFGATRIIPGICHTCSYIWYVHTRRTWYEAKQRRCVVSCTTFSYWGACWSKILVLIWYHMHVHTWGMLLLIFISKYFTSSVGTW